MAKNSRGRKKKAYQKTSRTYEWSSPSLRLAADICVFGVVGLLVAVALTFQNLGLAVRLFSGCFFLFGGSEFIRAADNKGKGGPKNATNTYLILGSVTVLAGLAFYVFVAANQPMTPPV